jgi:hypothetical protein
MVALCLHTEVLCRLQLRWLGVTDIVREALGITPRHFKLWRVSFLLPHCVSEHIILIEADTSQAWFRPPGHV